MPELFVKDKEFYKTVLKIAVPVVLQSIITIAVNMTDTVMLGIYGETQISASSQANELINLFQILCFGVGGGAAVLTAQYWGSKDIPSLKKVISIMLWIILSISVFFTAAAAFIPDLIMSIYSPEPLIIEKGVLYLRMSAATFPLIGLTLTLTIVMRTVHMVRLPLVATIMAFVGNIFGNWVFIYGNLGAPEMQIQGAALSTLLVRIAETCLVGGYFLFVDKRIGYRIRDFITKVSKYQVSIYIRYSVPVIVSDFFMAFGNTALSIIMGHIGSGFVAANAIIVQVVRLATVFNQGLSNASGIITGNTVGAGQKDKAYRQGITFLFLAIGMGIVAGGITLLVTPSVINLSIFNITDETRVLALEIMYGVVMMMLFQTVESVMTKGVLRGGGDTRFLMVADVLFLWIASIPLGYLAGLVFHVPAMWIYAALKIDWVIKSVWCVFRLRSKKWIQAAGR
ncbi:MATE family efflux transporter [Spirochaetia bacterium]|nr:MATE family efflux transporter [Spirochaetia bacterium]